MAIDPICKMTVNEKIAKSALAWQVFAGTLRPM